MNKALQLGVETTRYWHCSPKLKGYSAMILVLLIWSGFALSVRSIGTSPLTMIDVALVRFLTSFVLLIPFIPRHYHALRALRCRQWAGLLLGGVPFLFLASTGASSTPTAYVGSVLTGCPPLLLALGGFVFYRCKPTAMQSLSLLAIVLGILVMAQGGNDSADPLGMGLWCLLAAAWLWAGYTLGVKQAGLAPVALAIALAAGSLFITVILLIFDIFPSQLGNFSFQQALPYGIVQGIGVGIISTLGFGYAVRQLGSQPVATIGAMSPGLTAVLAMMLFHEPLSLLMLLGIGLTAIGVVLTSQFVHFK